jgi:hypothetical protein
MLTQLKSYLFVIHEKFEDTIEVIRNLRWTGNTIVKTKGTKRQTMIYKTLHRKLKIG